MDGGRRTANFEQWPQLELGFFAEDTGEVELQLIFGKLSSQFKRKTQLIDFYVNSVVGSTTWSATYDIRVSTQTEDTPVKIFYKAAITQSTGEVCVFILFIERCID